MPENLDPQLEPIERLSMNAAELMRRYPPRIENQNKQAVFEIALPGGSQPGGPDRVFTMGLPAAAG
jgi:hypothetical protein